MSNTSTIFLNNLTCIDHAYIDAEGRIVGGSYHPNFLVTGSIDPVEQVVIDFSSIKKQIKAIIDDKENGFDHKLWIYANSSNCKYTHYDGNTTIRSDALLLEMPTNAIKIIESDAETAIAQQVERELNKLHPHNNIKVQCELTHTNFARNPDSAIEFTYVHGLRSSTSWGCQNHSHGHRSWIDFGVDMGGDIEYQLLALTHELNGAVLIYKDNIVLDDDDYIAIFYTTPRGNWYAEYNKKMIKTIIFDTETTVENILNWFVAKNKDLLDRCGVKRLDISEGLSKGATYIAQQND
jgi:hypothetical protein